MYSNRRALLENMISDLCKELIDEYKKCKNKSDSEDHEPNQVENDQDPVQKEDDKGEEVHEKDDSANEDAETKNEPHSASDVVQIENPKTIQGNERPRRTPIPTINPDGSTNQQYYRR